MQPPRVYAHERSQEVPLWMVVTLVLAIGFLFGAIAHPFTGDGSQRGAVSLTQETPDPAFLALAQAQLAALTPTYEASLTPTRYATAIIHIVTVTPTATHDLPWCSYAIQGEPCYQPGFSPTQTPDVPRCDIVTPKAYAYVCRKSDDVGTSSQDGID